MKGNGVSEEAGQGRQAEWGGCDSEKTLPAGWLQHGECWGSVGLFYREVVGHPRGRETAWCFPWKEANAAKS